MSVPEILKTISGSFQSSATVKNVYGEPISTGGRTVIPVARISYGFGGGGGGREGDPTSEGGGGGGGGRMSASPAGVVEITSDGARFIPFVEWKKVASVAALSFLLGYALAVRRGR